MSLDRIIKIIDRSYIGQDITIFGNGRQTRSFCHVDDLVDGLIRLMDQEEGDVQLPVNLGNPGEFSMLELAQKILRTSGSTSRIVHEPLPQDDPRQRRPDISRAQRLLGWEPQITLDQGLPSILEWFRKDLEIS